MKYVLDSSVAVKWVSAEQFAAEARKLRDDLDNAVHEFLAPDIFTSELSHALTRAERQRRITVGEALSFWLNVMATPPQFFPALPLTVRSIEISSQMRIGVYDCLYIALAERELCEFITADDRLVNNLHTTFPFIIHLSAY
jgi:predicted nucleic acid-binding protein